MDFVWTVAHTQGAEAGKGESLLKTLWLYIFVIEPKQYMLIHYNWTSEMIAIVSKHWIWRNKWELETELLLANEMKLASALDGMQQLRKALQLLFAFYVRLVTRNDWI